MALGAEEVKEWKRPGCWAIQLSFLDSVIQQIFLVYSMCQALYLVPGISRTKTDISLCPRNAYILGKQRTGRKKRGKKKSDKCRGEK